MATRRECVKSSPVSVLILCGVIIFTAGIGASIQGELFKRDSSHDVGDRVWSSGVAMIVSGMIFILCGLFFWFLCYENNKVGTQRTGDARLVEQRRGVHRGEIVLASTIPARVPQPPPYTERFPSASSPPSYGLLYDQVPMSRRAECACPASPPPPYCEDEERRPMTLDVTALTSTHHPLGPTIPEESQNSTPCNRQDQRQTQIPS